MNKRQGKKYMRVIPSNYFVAKPIPHGFWKRRKEINKRFGLQPYGSPLPRWKTRLRWLNRQATAEIKKLFS